MDTLLSYLLSIILTAHASTAMKPEKILFSRLPLECAAEYDPFLRKERKAVSTDVIRLDLDGDGSSEMLVWTGNGGSAGEEWSIMWKDSRGWHRLGKVFGILYRVDIKPYRGLLVCNPCGWDQATWTFYQLRHGKLENMIEFEIHYRKPIREGPTAIKIFYGSNTSHSPKSVWADIICHRSQDILQKNEE